MVDQDWKRISRDALSSIKFLSRKERKKAVDRGIDIAPILEALGKFKTGIHELRDLARQEYRGAIQRYLLSFYDDSIYHATFSVEMGLLVRLEEKLSTQEKSELHFAINKTNEKPTSMTFGKVYDIARRRNLGIINGKDINRKIEAIIETRNIHIHASNFLSATIISMKKTMVPQMEFSLKQIENLENQPIGSIISFLPRYKRLLSEQLELFKELPDFVWCTDDKNRQHAEDDIQTYLRGLSESNNTLIPKKPSTPEKIIAVTKLKSYFKTISEDTYLKKESLDTLRNSFEVLKGIDIF